MLSATIYNLQTLWESAFVNQTLIMLRFILIVLAPPIISVLILLLTELCARMYWKYRIHRDIKRLHRMIALERSLQHKFRERID